MILARLAMGTGALPPCVPSKPVPGSPTAASAPPGQSGRGAAPGRTRTVVTEAVRAIAGTGRSSSTATQTTAAARMTAPAISRRDRSLRPRPAPAGRRPARRGAHSAAAYGPRPEFPAAHDTSPEQRSATRSCAAPAARRGGATTSQLVARMLPALPKAEVSPLTGPVRRPGRGPPPRRFADQAPAGSAAATCPGCPLKP